MTNVCQHAFANVPSSEFPVCVQCRESVYFLLDAAERQVEEQQDRIAELETENTALQQQAAELMTEEVGPLQARITELELEFSRSEKRGQELGHLVEETELRLQTQRMTELQWQIAQMLPIVQSMANLYLDACSCLIDDHEAKEHAPDCIASKARKIVQQFVRGEGRKHE